MNRIVCQKWGTRFSPEYVNNLYRSCKDHLTEPFTFHCFTDDSHGILPDVNTHSLLSDPQERGWWTKIDMFRSDIPSLIGEGTVLMLDLDVVIIDNIDDLFTFGCEDDFIVLKDVEPKNGFNSSVVRFKGGTESHIFEDLNLSEIEHSIYKGKGFGNKKYWGDQIWITERKQSHNNTRILPIDWVQSYKKQCLDKKGQFQISENTKILLFHGDPMPHECLHHIQRFWN